MREPTRSVSSKGCAKSRNRYLVDFLVGALSKHCVMCLNLNGCCFFSNKCPPKPLHPNCHCYTIDIPSIEAQTECSIEKFTKYVFVSSLISDKKLLFELWGYARIY